jgi:outer membrane protein assembly factor BamA
MTPHLSLAPRRGKRLMFLLAAALVPTGCAAKSGSHGQPVPAPADTAFRRSSILPLPVVFYTPETRWAGGGAALLAYRRSAEERPVTTAATLIHTQNRQTMSDASVDAYLDGGRYHLSGNAGYSRFPADFYGIGNASPATASEEFTPRSLMLQGLAELRVAPALYAGLGGEFSSLRMLEVEPGRALASGTIAGSGGGDLAGLAAAVTYDSRDNTIAARSGGYARLLVRHYAEFAGSDFGFTRTDLDLRRFRSFGGDHVVAVQGVWSAASGDVPFYRLPELGGQNLLRGFYQGRYRDRQLIAAQAEYRTPGWRRMGLAAFAGAGQVADGVDGFTLSNIHVAAGAGLRVTLNRQERMALRLDYGVGGRGSGFYITVGEAF